MSDEIKKSIVEIEGFVKIASKIDYSRPDLFAFNLLVRSSFVKCYEFLRTTFLSDSDANYFFDISYLRSIIEDIIVLKSIHSFSSDTRDTLLRQLQLLELNERILTQWHFFQKYRPFQPVIDSTVAIDDATIKLQQIWQENGWPKFEVTAKNRMPPVRQLAQKLAPGILDLLYDFIYRLTSGNVHFSVQTLYRMSWGNIDGENFSGTLSSHHMSNYYKQFCKIYGPLLFSFYFEFFSEDLGAGQKELSVIVDIRKSILSELRWPEMITFEEMNLAVPDAYHDKIIPNAFAHIKITEMLKNGFINEEFEKFLALIKVKSR